MRVLRTSRRKCVVDPSIKWSKDHRHNIDLKIISHQSTKKNIPSFQIQVKVQYKYRPIPKTWISIKPGFWDIMAKEANFLTVKYLTGYIQSLAVLTSTVDVSTAGLWTYPVKYFMLLRGCLIYWYLVPVLLW